MGFFPSIFSRSVRIQNEKEPNWRHETPTEKEIKTEKQEGSVLNNKNPNEEWRSGSTSKENIQSKKSRKKALFEDDNDLGRA